MDCPHQRLYLYPPMTAGVASATSPPMFDLIAAMQRPSTDSRCGFALGVRHFGAETLPVS